MRWPASSSFGDRARFWSVQPDWSAPDWPVPSEWGKPEPEEEEEAAPKRTPAKAAEPAPAKEQCSNPACAGAFDDAAKQGTPLVTAGAEGC